MTPRAIVGIVCLAIVATVVVSLRLGDSGTVVRAEFTNARGLLEGNEVRIQGAPAGRVDKIELTDRNTAMVALRLDDRAPAIREDATAAIRPVDLLGDIYLSLAPGVSARPLSGAIATSRTSNAPRLDDLLRAFDPEARSGLRAMFVELGLAFERRGADVHAAILRLRPALEATDALMRELDDQRANLTALVTDAQRATGQLAARRDDLGRTLTGLATTVRAVADRDDSLDAALRAAPGLLSRLRSTAARLSQTTRAARPVATELDRAAPDLAAVATTLPDFAREARPALDDARPLVDALGATLSAARTSAPRLASGLDALASAAPDVDRLSVALVPAAKPISEGFFVNFADQAAEPGTQPFDPFGDKRRHYWRGAAVFSCETFGLPVRSGCLDEFLRSRAGDATAPPRARTPSAPVRDRRPPAPARPAAPEGGLPAARPSRPSLPDLPARVDDLVDGVLDGVLGPRDRPSSGPGLLDFLLGP